MLTTLFVSRASAITVWEMEEPLEISLTAEDIITYDQLNGALAKTDCTAFVEDKHAKVPANDNCWHYSKKGNCPNKGYIKFDEVPLINARVGAAAVNVENGNEVSLVVGNVTYDIQKTKFTAQPEGLFTLPCDGVLSGVITGAAAAVKGVVDLAAEGVPIIGELAAEPIDGVIMDIEHKLLGFCGLIESILQGILTMIGQVIQDFLQTTLPQIVQTLLTTLVNAALMPTYGRELLLE